MNKMFIAAIALTVPTFALAEVQINFNAYASAQASTGYETISNDEQWFEERESTGSAKMSFEYQWNNNNGIRILHYRQVQFFPMTGAWVFGPWMLRDGYCHSSCHLHHRHHFYHPVAYAPQWRMEYNRYDQRPHYFYGRHEYYDHPRHVAPVNTYYHREYPSHVRYERHEYYSREHRPVDNHYDAPRERDYQRPHYQHEQQCERPQYQQNGQHYERPQYQHNEQQPIVRVTQREHHR